MAQRPPRPAIHRSLTLSEQRILDQVLAGQSNAEIARTRETSARTVANQIAALYRKLGVKSRRELRAWSAHREALPDELD